MKQPPLTWIYARSHFVRFVLHEVFDCTHLIISKSERNRKAVDALAEIQNLVVGLDGLLGDRGITFALVMMPMQKELARNRYNWLNGLGAFAKQHGVRVIGSMASIRERVVNGGADLQALYWSSDNHFTPLGYRYFAEAVEEGLIAPGKIRSRE